MNVFSIPDGASHRGCKPWILKKISTTKYRRLFIGTTDPLQPELKIRSWDSGDRRETVFAVRWFSICRSKNLKLKNSVLFFIDRVAGISEKLKPLEIFKSTLLIFL